MESFAAFLLYLLWFLMVSLVIILWVAAISDIKNHVRKGLFKPAELRLMAVAVSVVAVSAIVAANAVVRDRWVEVGSREAVSAASTEAGCGDYYTFTYGFIPERMVRESRNCTENPPRSFARDVLR
jgi:hypothetical protein